MSSSDQNVMGYLYSSRSDRNIFPILLCLIAKLEDTVIGVVQICIDIPSVFSR